MSHGSLGQMANAPLALVLAQVRFSPYLTISTRVPALQDALRKTYPVLRHEQTQSIDIGPNAGGPRITTEDVWHFSDADSRAGFTVQQNSVVFITTRYSTYDDFAQRHAVILNAFEQAVPDVFVDRLGLRYLDVIVPLDGEGPENYVVPGLKGCDISALPGEAFRSQYVARWKLGDGMMVFRFTSGVESPFLPQDLRSINLSGAEVMTRAGEAKTRIGTMDFDRILPHREPYNAVGLSRFFSDMHGDLSRIFRGAMSQHAEAVWDRKL